MEICMHILYVPYIYNIIYHIIYILLYINIHILYYMICIYIYIVIYTHKKLFLPPLRGAHAGENLAGSLGMGPLAPVAPWNFMEHN